MTTGCRTGAFFWGLGQVGRRAHLSLSCSTNLQERQQLFPRAFRFGAGNRGAGPVFQALPASLQSLILCRWAQDLALWPGKLSAPRELSPLAPRTCSLQRGVCPTECSSATQAGGLWARAPQPRPRNCPVPVPSRADPTTECEK